MPHLVKPLGTADAPVSIADCLRAVEAAHDYLAGCAARTLRDLPAPSPDWGIRMKRLSVTLEGARPALVVDAPETHNLTEIYTQCATMERLCAALDWAQTALAGYQVIGCHPTTSSAASAPDNDLVLRGAAGDLACFEVSDVVGHKDGNRKQAKELRSLGVTPGVPFSGRRFLVASGEFAAPLRGKAPAGAPQYRYRAFDARHDTVILEIVPVETV